MTADPLLARLSAVPMRCGNCGLTGDIQAGCGASYQHAWETDDAAIARAVRAWLKSVEPTEREVYARMPEGRAPYINDAVVAIRDLYRRAWEATP